MNETLSIRNFGPIVSADIIIKPRMILIGPQASGKSTVAKLIAILRNIDLIAKPGEELNFKNYCSYYNIGNYFQSNTRIEYSSDKYDAKYDQTYDEQVKFLVKKSGNFQNDIRKENERIEQLLKTLLKSNQDAERDRENYFKVILDANWKSLFSIMKDQIYIPAERILLSVADIQPTLYSSFSKCLVDFISLFFFARNNLKELEVDFLRIKLKNENNKHNIYYNEGGFVALNESASGLQATIPMLLVIENLVRRRRDFSFIIEEPELNLYPSSQKGLIYKLIALSSRNIKNELIITTHSPYTLSVFNTLLMAYTTANSEEKIKENVRKILPDEYWVNPDSFNAYFLNKGTATKIFDEKTKLISENDLDSVSEDIQAKFDDLIEIYQNTVLKK